MVAASVVLGLLSGAVVAQDPPDFSGAWVLIGPTAAAGSATEINVHQESRYTSVKGEPLSRPAVILTITRRSADARMTRDVVRVGTVGGRVGAVSRDGRGTGPDGQVTRTAESSSWSGTNLVLAKSEYNGPSRTSGPYVERTETWSLDSDGMLLIRVEEQRSNNPPINETLRYRKK